ncbi:MAG: efflux RND transporter periplasmic adaptor subunit [Bacteroidales bacterium]|nr:efflux RND transporter periplasmic adaptor subunit [Bacteroidales bacterium]
MKRKTWVIVISILIVAVLAVVFFRSSDITGERKDLFVKVQRGDFSISVTTVGELEARKSTEIMGPENLRQVRIWQVKITHIVPEGTVVKEGEYVAELDKSELTGRVKDLELEIDNLQSQYLTTKLDTTMSLRLARDELIDLAFSYQEKKIVVEQSEYEPPAVRRQAQIDLEKTERSLKQAKKNYALKRQQAEAKMRTVELQLAQGKRRMQEMMEVLQQFTVTAPQAGMVVYTRNSRGAPQGEGSFVNAWYPVVAQLPDLTTMISKTYVNEIDISKINTGQKVVIEIDAFPGQRYAGSVINVANIGEQRPGSSAKVFEVKVEFEKGDTSLRPAMTSKNIIITEVVKDVVFVPLESIYHIDTVSYVFKKEGVKIVKQQIVTGKSNDNHVIIEAGLTPDDEVMVNEPDDADELKLILLQQETSEEN